MTEKQAGIEASKQISDSTQSEKVEYGGLLYKDSNGMYLHTDPLKGGMTTVDPTLTANQVPRDAQVTAAYHSHPPNTGLFMDAQPERFSAGDMKFGNGRNSLNLRMNIYLVAPSGNVSVLLPGSMSGVAIGKIR